MWLLTRRKKPPARLGYLGISVLSATAHNIGQLFAASILAGTPLWAYLPPLILFGALFGAVTGVVLGIIMPALRRFAPAGDERRATSVEDARNER